MSEKLSTERLQGKEKKNELESIVPQAVEQALELVRELAEAKRLEFHDVEHTRRVVSRYITIIQVFQKYGVEVSKRDVLLGIIGAAFHDVVQEYDVSEKEEVHRDQTFTRKTRVRRAGGESGGNEYESAQMAIQFLRENCRDFTESGEENDASKILEQILVTVPEFRPSEGVVQVNLNEKSSVIARALAMADLGTSGMEPADFVADSDKLFRENNIDIKEAIYKINTGYKISDIEQEYYKARMIKWCEDQKKFPMERREKVDKELNSIKSIRKNKNKFLQEVFHGFAESIKNISQSYGIRKEMSFFELAKDMGYEIKAI